MQIDYALILSAGMGTRMGNIGKIIPKVMWPILDRPLIDLQIEFCKSLGIKRVFINTHYLANVLEEHLERKYGKEITILHEEPLLNSGGAIHNLARQKEVNYRGNVLLVNGDQFFFFDKSFFHKAQDLLKTNRASLFGIRVSKEEKYNEVKTVDANIVSIERPSGESDYYTYSGMGILKLDGLNPVEGISHFFESVVNFKKENSVLVSPTGAEYWDFGTFEIYFNNIFRLTKKEFRGKQFEKFLQQNGVNLNDLQQYISLERNSIRLSLDDNFVEGAIVFNGVAQKR